MEDNCDTQGLGRDQYELVCGHPLARSLVGCLDDALGGFGEFFSDLRLLGIGDIEGKGWGYCEERQ